MRLRFHYWIVKLLYKVCNDLYWRYAKEYDEVDVEVKIQTHGELTKSGTHTIKD